MRGVGLNVLARAERGQLPEASRADPIFSALEEVTIYPGRQILDRFAPIHEHSIGGVLLARRR
jgi:hypothetical protein